MLTCCIEILIRQRCVRSRAFVFGAAKTKRPNGAKKRPVFLTTEKQSERIVQSVTYVLGNIPEHFPKIFQRPARSKQRGRKGAIRGPRVARYGPLWPACGPL